MEKDDFPFARFGGIYNFFEGANINNINFFNDGDKESHSSKKEEVVDKSKLSDEKIARDIEANCGDGEPLESKRKWAAEEEEWEEEEATGLSPARLSKLDEIIETMKKGDWKRPATAENIEMLLNVVFGRDDSLFDEGDREDCEKLWELIEGGTGERMIIVPANLAGFFSELNLLQGTPKTISKDLFGKDNQDGKIIKGRTKYCSNAFRDVIPFLTKYINKLIRN